MALNIPIPKNFTLMLSSDNIFIAEEDLQVMYLSLAFLQRSILHQLLPGHLLNKKNNLIILNPHRRRCPHLLPFVALAIIKKKLQPCVCF